jgi:hypothetical protein
MGELGALPGRKPLSPTLSPVYTATRREGAANPRLEQMRALSAPLGCLGSQARLARGGQPAKQAGGVLARAPRVSRTLFAASVRVLRRSHAVGEGCPVTSACARHGYLCAGGVRTRSGTHGPDDFHPSLDARMRYPGISGATRGLRAGRPDAWFQNPRNPRNLRFRLFATSGPVLDASAAKWTPWLAP